MDFFFFIFVWINLLIYAKTYVHECPNYAALNKPREKKNGTPVEKSRLQCNLLMTNPKKVINRYRHEKENYVESKPFGSICLKCSLCLAIAKEMDDVFKQTLAKNRENKQTTVVDLLQETLNALCADGFDNYDLRKFEKFQVVTSDFNCNTHVQSKMDGQWPNKLREMCTLYADHMDVQLLLNDYLKEINDLTSYLCNNTGIFRDCFSLDFRDTSIPTKENEALMMC